MSNEALLLRVARSLTDFPWKLVYVGGATTHLYLTDRTAPPVTFTQDVDVVVEVRSRAEYLTEVHAALRAAGAREDTREDAPVCRWILDGVQLDVMPAREELLGFANRWYEEVLENPVSRIIGEGVKIHITTAALFVATKLEAFANRGRGDMLSSKDVEDVLALIDGRPELAQDMAKSSNDARSYIMEQLASWLERDDLEYAVFGYLRGESARASTVLERIRMIASSVLM
jgi:hypothetical protein